MISDFHVHTWFSADSDENPETIIKQAISLGMNQLCFTDHQDFDYNYDEFDFTLDHDRYIKFMSLLKDKYSDKIDLRIGLEIGLEPHLADVVAEFVSQHPYDFVIGSTHLIKGIDPYYPEFFEGRKDTEAFMEYFEYLNKSIDTCNDFDVYGHLDYIVRYAPEKNKNFSYIAYADIIDEILKKLIYKGKGMEVNTAGLYKGLGTTNPATDIIKRYKELGGEIITIGSDAHMAKNLGYGFESIPETLKSCGFNYYNIFKNRKPEKIYL